MTTAQLNKKIGDIVEQKLLEFFGDPDAGLELKKSFVAELKKSMKTRGKTVPHSAVMMEARASLLPLVSKSEAADIRTRHKKPSRQVSRTVRIAL